MTNQVVLLHGWSATSTSMLKVQEFLQGNGFPVLDLWLGDYISLDDDVRVADVAKRMDVVLREALASGKLKRPFDMIVHSTGGLVSREWLTGYAQRWAGGSPLKRLVMLAPANFGSALAAKGKSFIGRVAKGWNNWFQTGEEMLNDLELASAYQWELAGKDLIAQTQTQGQPSPYGPGKVLPFVLCGSRGYTSGLQPIVNEDGSDGTVRPSAANLNISGFTIDFRNGEQQPEVTPWEHKAGAGALAFAVLPERNHSSILEPKDGAGYKRPERLGQLILDALKCEDAGYAALCAAWKQQNETIGALATEAEIAAEFVKNPPKPSELHPHMQVVVHVVDDQDRSVDDFFIEFFAPGEAGDKETVIFHQKVLKSVRTNSLDASRRCLFLDRSNLMSDYYQGSRSQVAMSLSAARLGANIRYFDSTKEGAKGELVVHQRTEAARDAMGEERLRRHQTHFIKIIIPRQPIDKVFKLKQ